MECAASDICVLDSTTTSVDDQRFFYQLEEPTGLCIPPFFPNSEVPGENTEGEGDDGVGVPSVAIAGLVPSPSGDGRRCAENNKTTAGVVDIQFATTSSATRIVDSDRVESIRRRFRNKGFSEEVVNLLLDSNRVTTRSSYQSAWNNWFDWCIKRGLDPLLHDLNNVLQYLTELHGKGYATRTINVHRSMLSMTLDPIDAISIGEHPLISRLLEGCFNLNPPQPRYNSTWDPEVVISHLSKFGDDHSMSFSQLSQKLVTLLALATLMRVSELASISTNSVSFLDTKVSFSLLRPRKSQRSGPLQSFSVQKFEDNPCSPVSCFTEYWSRTTVLRSSNCNTLFVLTKKPHTAATPSTLGRWIKSAISAAGIDSTIFSAHSIRGAGASKAAASGVAIESILRAASWSSESTFARFYRKPVLTNPVTDAIFSQTSSRL